MPPAFRAVLTVTNSDLLGSSGNAKTAVQVTVTDPGGNFNFSPTIISPQFNYLLGAGASVSSGNLSNAPPVTNSTSGTMATVAEFTGALPGQTITLSGNTSTTSLLANTGGNTTATQVTTASLTVTVKYTYNPAPLALTCSAATGQLGSIYSSSLSATGGVLPYTFSISAGALPTGLMLSNAVTGALTGTPTTVGSFPFTAKVVDSSGLGAAATTTSACNITVGPPPAPPPPVLIPDMTISKSHTGTFTAGQAGATYTLTASNVGNTATTGTATVTDTLPVGITATAIGGTGWSCTLASLSCTRSDSLAPFAAYPTITVTVNIATSATGTLVNTAVVGGGGETNLTNDTATDPVTIVGLPDLTIAKTHVGTSFSPGGSVTFTLTASNVGAAPTTAVATVSDTLPAGLTATAISGPTWSCTLAPLTCTIHSVLNQGASFPTDHRHGQYRGQCQGDVLINNATVGGGGEVNLTNDTANDSITVLVPDLTITKSHTGASFFSGGSVTFTLTASNVGAGPTVGTVTVSDTLPAGLSATAISGAAPWSCTLAPLSCATTAVLAPGAAYPPIAVMANITGSGTLVNNAAIGGGGETNLTNDNATDSIIVLVPDMTITKSHTGTAFTAGGTATFTLTASNIGPVPTFGTVTVTDSLPAGLTATAVSGAPTWICTLSPLSCTTAVVLAPGASYPPISLVTSISTSASGTCFTNNGHTMSRRAARKVNLTN